MCGIFGYIGKQQNAAEIILDGLKTLEYRGYDSWGIAAKANDTILVDKRTGKIGQAQTNLPQSSLGIGHTRWATHGGVTQDNAHPHLDCTKQLAVLHNGIVENFQELKTKLVQKGHKFSSETDTEVIAHLLEDEMKKKSFVDAIRATFNKLNGLNAIVAVNTTSSEIVAAKNGSPLIVGIGKDEYFLASDTAGVLPYTKHIIFMKDNEMIALRNTSDEKIKMKFVAFPTLDDTSAKNKSMLRVEKGEKPVANGKNGIAATGVRLFSLPDGKEINPEIETISWTVESANKGKYEHFMLKEINEQPRIIRNIAKTYSDQILTMTRVIQKAESTFFIGCGTAYHACLAGTYLFSKIAGHHVSTAPASEYAYLEQYITNKSVIIPLSQSGETIDIIEPLTNAKQKGSKMLSFVNVLGSTIYRMGDHKMLLGAGPEKAVASTKAYIAKISILTMLAYALIGKLATAKEILLKSADEVERLLGIKSVTNIKKIAKDLSKKEHLYILGRGFSYTTALEGALKIKEVSYIHTEGLAGGELKHGSIALIEKGVPCIILAPADETYNSIISNAMEVKARGGFIIGIAAKQHPVFDEWIEVKETGSSLLTHIIPFQLLSYYLAIIKKLDPDKPRNLAKSVTVK